MARDRVANPRSGFGLRAFEPRTFRRINDGGTGMSERIQLRRSKGWRKPEGVVTVSRPSRWGNPYRATLCHRVACGPTSGWCVSSDGGTHHTRMPDRECAIRSTVAAFEEAWAHPNLRAEIQGALRGKDLACWCPLDAPCHADVLLEIANSGHIGDVGA